MTPRDKSLLGGSAREYPSGGRGGGMLPCLRPRYTVAEARALFELAESNPTPERYAKERARILDGRYRT